jgi:hypothetical protein
MVFTAFCSQAFWREAEKSKQGILSNILEAIALGNDCVDVAKW